MSKLVLIDGNAIIHRAYHSMPKTLRTRKGEQTNAVYGFAVTLIKVLEDLKPDYLAATFDLAGPTFRHEVFEDYKATRVKADQELYDQIPRVKQLVEAMGIPIYEKEGFEADDVIGTIVQRIQNSKIKSQNCNSKLKINTDHEAIEQLNNLTIFIVSGDKDIFQLINGHVKVYNLRKGLNDTQIVDSTTIKELYGLDPHDFIDLKALAGDPSDNIPGVPGIGPKTATELVQKFDTLEKLYETIEKFEILNSKSETNSKSQISNLETAHTVIARNEAVLRQAQDRFLSKEIAAPPTKGMARNDNNLTMQQFNNDAIDSIAKELGIKPRILKLLIENKEQAFLSQHLATIHRDVPIDFSLEQCKWGEYDKEKLRELFEELGFQSLLRRFGKNQDIKTSRHQESTEVQKKDSQLKLL